MNNKEQSAGTIAGQSTEAEVTNVSHNNGNTNVGCSLSDVSAETVFWGQEMVNKAKEYLWLHLNGSCRDLILNMVKQNQASPDKKLVFKEPITIEFSRLLNT